MTFYEFLLTVHIMTAVLWVGGGTMILILATKMRAANDGPSIVRIGQTGEQLGKTFFMPLAVVQLLSGIWLVLEADWGFERLWVIAGILGIVSSSVIGAVFLGPLGGKIAVLVQEKGMQSPEVRAGLDRIFMLNRIDVAILFFVIFLMTTKLGS